MKAILRNSRPIYVDRIQGEIFLEWHCYKKQAPDADIESAEKMFYQKHFKEYIERHNESCITGRHKDRMITVDIYLTRRATYPETTEYFLTGMGSSITEIKTFAKAVSEHIDWIIKNYPNIKMLDFVVYRGKNGPCVRERHVWIAHDRYGNEIVSQEKALAEMNVPPLFPDRPVDRTNNAKLRFTDACRRNLVEICMRNGIQ